MKRFFLFALLIFAGPVMAQQQYYVWDGSNLQPLFNTQGLICDHWAIWLYTDDTADPQPAKGWGEIDGASAGEVQEKYQKERDNIEHLLASDHTGYEVHLGPVAVIKPPPQADNPLFGTASKEEDDLCDRLIKDFDLANQLIDAAKKFQGLYYQDQGGGLYLKPKTELQEYLEGFHDMMEKVNELRHKLNDINGPPLAEIQGQLDALNQSLSTVESQGQTLANKMQHQSTDNIGDPSDWLEKPYDDGDGWLVNVLPGNSLEKEVIVSREDITYQKVTRYPVFYSNISAVNWWPFNNRQVGINFAAPVEGQPGVCVEFSNPVQAKEFYNFLLAHTAQESIQTNGVWRFP